jgi:hypothetical protein
MDDHHLDLWLNQMCKNWTAERTMAVDALFMDLYVEVLPALHPGRFGVWKRPTELPDDIATSLISVFRKFESSLFTAIDVLDLATKYGERCIFGLPHHPQFTASLRVRRALEAFMVRAHEALVAYVALAPQHLADSQIAYGSALEALAKFSQLHADHAWLDRFEAESHLDRARRYKQVLDEAHLVPAIEERDIQDLRARLRDDIASAKRTGIPINESKLRFANKGDGIGSGIASLIRLTDTEKQAMGESANALFFDVIINRNAQAHASAIAFDAFAVIDGDQVIPVKAADAPPKHEDFTLGLIVERYVRTVTELRADLPPNAPLFFLALVSARLPLDK